MNVPELIKMNILSKIKTNNMLVDIIVSTSLIYAFTYICKHYGDIIMYFRICFTPKHERKYHIEMLGTKITFYHSNPLTHNLYSLEIKAILFFFSKEIGNNKSMVKLKQSYSSNDEDSNFIIDQPNEFILDKNLDIYGRLYILKEKSVEETKSNQSNAGKIEKIIIVISSDISSLVTLKNWIQSKVRIYTQSLCNSRHDKLFTYALSNDCGNTWRETEFLCHRSFDNMFFDGKKNILAKIDFFMNSKQWYSDKGIPYTLGIGLYGPPGTGKTSFIKSLSKYTKRHIVQLSLKGIRTKGQLERYFYESRYSSHNGNNSIGFDKKIIIMEDIDCLGDIVKNRQSVNTNTPYTTDSIKSLSPSEVKKALAQAVEEEAKITLDDILNLWDGICETPGRMIIISSNCYDELDPALVRPGRIDITLGLQNASYNVIREMFEHFYNIPVDEDRLIQIKEHYFSPAEIINMYHDCVDNSSRFYDELIKKSCIEKKNTWINKD